jgi:hypothetical protein
MLTRITGGRTLFIQSTTTHGLCILPKTKGARPMYISRILWKTTKNFLRLSHLCIHTKTATHEHGIQMQTGIRTSKACHLSRPSLCKAMGMLIFVVWPSQVVRMKFNPSAKSSTTRTEEPNARICGISSLARTQYSRSPMKC